MVNKNVPNLVGVQELVARKALFVVSHSGGKDSQAMMAVIRELVPAEQILVVHADLSEVDWKGTVEHIQATIGSGAEFRICKAKKSFLEMVEKRGMFPSPQYRQCTSDLKTGPIEKCIRHYLQERNLPGLVVNCMGIRAAESTSRAKKEPFKVSTKNSKAGREWYDWMPIFHYSTEEVFAEIAAAGQKPHWAYGAGMSRLSCCFCIMASKRDLRIAAQHNKELFDRYVELEKKIGHTMFLKKKQPVSLAQYIAEDAE